MTQRQVEYQRVLTRCRELHEMLDKQRQQFPAAWQQVITNNPQVIGQHPVYNPNPTGLAVGPLWDTVAREPDPTTPFRTLLQQYFTLYALYKYWIKRVDTHTGAIAAPNESPVVSASGVKLRGSGIQSLLGILMLFNEEDMSPVGEHRPGSKRSDAPLSHIGAGSDVPYLTRGVEKRSDGVYDVVTCSFYYKDNPAIGFGWQLRPKDPSLGYHPDDIEFVSIYYQGGQPKKVYYSTHGSREGHWRSFADCEVRDGYLVTYVARNSHANYPDNGDRGTHTRIGGFANDYTSTRGPSRRFTFEQMQPSFNWNNGKGISLYQGLRPAPPDTTMTGSERRSLRQTFKLGKLRIKI